MSQDRLYKLFEKQRKRQIAALLAVCTPEERERIKIARQDYGLKGQHTIAQPSGLGGSSHPPGPSPCKGRIKSR
jgi:hypothetical protein